MFERRIVAAVLALANTVACGGGSEDPAPPTSTPTPTPDTGTTPPAAGAPSHDQMLAALGVNTNLPKEPVDAEGKTLPSGYHPLRRPYAAFNPKSEIFLGGPTIGTSKQTIFDDGFSATPFPTMPFAPTNTSWTDNPMRTAIAADVNGDGDDEIVVVYYIAATKELRIHAIDRDANGMWKESVPVSIATNLTVVPDDPSWLANAVAAYNVDDDAAQEIAIGFGDVYVLDDLAANFKTITKIPYGSTKISLDAGDIDGKPGDKVDELVVSYTDTNVAYFDIFDGTQRTLHRDTTTILNNAARETHLFTHALVKLVQLDKDAGSELAFYGLRKDTGYWDIRFADDVSTDFAWYRSFIFNVAPDRFDLSPLTEVLQPVDLDGDGIDEVLVDRWMFSNLQNIVPSSSTATFTDPVAGTKHDDVRLHTHGTGVFIAVDRAQPVRRGNLSGLNDTADGRHGEELAAVDAYGQKLVVGGLDGGVFKWKEIANLSGATGVEAIAVGNFDRDSAIVHFENQHELLFSDPQLVAGLSSPPFYSEKEQNTGNCYTAFGQKNGSEVSASQSMGISVGWSIGYEADVLFGLVKSETSLSFEMKFDSLSTTSREVTESITYATGPEDSVVFTVAPFDVYYYTVVSSPDAADVGKTVSINIPRKTQTLLATSKFYDANNGDLADSASMFTHTVGDPRSYPTPAKRDADCAGGCYKSRLATVGEGNGFTEVDVSKTETTSTETSFDFSVKAEQSFKTGGVKVGASAGFHYGFAIGAKTSNETVFTGRVANLYTLTPEKDYSFGLYAHVASSTLMIDYWTE